MIIDVIGTVRPDLLRVLAAHLTELILRRRRF